MILQSKEDERMNKQVKIKQYGVAVLLIAVCFMLVGLIYMTGQRDDENSVVGEVERQDTTIEVGSIVVDQEDDVVVEVDPIVTEGMDEMEAESDDTISDNGIEVQPIDPVSGSENASATIVETIEEPMAEEPEKPELTPPDEIPETDDDLTNPDVVPEYDELEVTYVPEPEVVEPEDEVRGSNLVPDSENPFLQDDIPGNGDGGEMRGEDYDEGNPSGEGDKF